MIDIKLNNIYRYKNFYVQITSIYDDGGDIYYVFKNSNDDSQKDSCFRDGDDFHKSLKELTKLDKIKFL